MGTEPGSGSAGQAAYEHLVYVHGMYRRELVSLRKAIMQWSAHGDPEMVTAAARRFSSRAGGKNLRVQCQVFCQALGVHHEFEDTQMFPVLRGTAVDADEIIERLMADHRQIANLLDRLDDISRELPSPADMASAVAELGDSLEAHLDFEEASLAPLFHALRA